ncbi:MAG TPA: 4'-phosphopantetheinyl transferase superfamily protein [Solirubrobacteraceae bacterium]|jgi:4'-phosphopantetheinyl transferase EntD|nr:4'-phosphopantetheinyl transferase superfamily protein [Solirubrobacteraceae bacterium]
MIEEILPACVVAVEAGDDRAEAAPYPEEEALLGDAVEKRRREFATGRMCARSALQKLGFPASAILRGPRGEPLWPAGAVGSITHCDGYRAAAVARSSEIVTVGIDAEPHAELPEGVYEQIARPEELVLLRRLRSEWTAVHWDRLLFSVKESVYKAWFPLAARWLGFEDVSVSLEAGTHKFVARLLAPGPMPALADGPPDRFFGGWTIGEGLVLTAVVAAARAPTT